MANDTPAWLRKGRKLVRDPRQFVVDALVKRGPQREAPNTSESGGADRNQNAPSDVETNAPDPAAPDAEIDAAEASDTPRAETPPGARAEADCEPDADASAETEDATPEAEAEAEPEPAPSPPVRQHVVGASAEPLVARLFSRPEEFLHPRVGRPGFTMPDPVRLKLYRIDSPSVVEELKYFHGVSCDYLDGSLGNVVAVDRTVKAVGGSISFRGSNNVCVLGQNAHFSGAIKFRSSDSRVVLTGDAEERVLQLNADLHSDGQRVFVGEGTSTQGMRTSIRGRDIAVIVGDDCLLSWQVWFRPSDMHAIVGLDSLEVINPAASIEVEPHAWIQQEVLLSRGAKVKAGSIVAAKSVVPAGLEHSAGSLLSGHPAVVMQDGVTWDRAHDTSPELIERVVRVREQLGWLPTTDDGDAAGGASEDAGQDGTAEAADAPTEE